MDEFNAETDSAYLQKWYVDLVADQVEFANLFTAPLRNLAALCAWIHHTKFFYEADRRGFWFCGWITPMLTDGAEVGAWIRKDRRGTRSALRAVEYFYDSIVLPAVPCFIGLTVQYPALHELHLKLGYTLSDTYPGVFDGRDVWVYKMTRESRAGRVAVQEELRAQRRAAYGRKQQQIAEQRNEQSVESLRGNAGEVRDRGPEERTARIGRIVGAGRRSIKDWWYNKPDPDHQSAGGRGETGRVDEQPEHSRHPG